MTARRPCAPAPGPLEDDAVQFDSLFHARAQRHGFRTYFDFEGVPLVEPYWESDTIPYICSKTMPPHSWRLMQPRPVLTS